ncbi:hypothetical protein Mapa_000158 [Marchantia paleacea]|nr:hypothetical protein Mapa_000158 [Marchantia paleacea]
MQATSPASEMTDARLTSAAAFVEGGVQDACDDACSICLENFCENDPATITNCKHEYHLQCILEWSQRSKECPMCWQPLSLKDPDSQALLAASEQERLMRRQRSSPFYQRSPLDDTEFHRFASSYGDDSDLEDRIMQHLAAAAMGRAQQFARRGEPLRFRPSPGQGHPHFMIVPAHSNTSPNHLANSLASTGGSVSPTSSTTPPDVISLGSSPDQAPAGQNTPTYGRSVSEPVRGSRSVESSSMDSYSLRQRALLEPVEESQQGTSSSELQSFSESFKSRIAAASSRYRESLTKTTRGFRERLRVRNGAMADLGARAREVSAGVVRALERISLESADKNRDNVNAPNSSAGIDTQVGTTLNQSGPSRVSDGSEGQECSSSSSGANVHAGSVTASSSRVAPQPSGVEASHSVGSTPAKAQGNEETSNHGHDLQQTPAAGPLPV